MCLGGDVLHFSPITAKIKIATWVFFIIVYLREMSPSRLTNQTLVSLEFFGYLVKRFNQYVKYNNYCK